MQDALLAQSGTKDLGLTPSAVYVARMGTIPSILVETAFLTNTSDAALLASDAMRSKMAIGIANGISAMNRRFLPMCLFTGLDLPFFA